MSRCQKEEDENVHVGVLLSPNISQIRAATLKDQFCHQQITVNTRVLQHLAAVSTVHLNHYGEAIFSSGKNCSELQPTQLLQSEHPETCLPSTNMRAGAWQQCF